MINLFRKKEDKFSYVEKGEGTPIILLHGLMGGLSNFDSTIEFFSKKFSKKICESGLFRYRFKVKTFAIKVQNFTSGLHCSHYLLPFF